MSENKKKRVSFFISKNMDNDIRKFYEPTFDLILGKRDSVHSQVFKMAYNVFRTDPRYLREETRAGLINWANECCQGNIDRAISILLEGKKK